MSLIQGGAGDALRFSNEQVGMFAIDGFLSLDRITSREEVEQIRLLADDLVAKKAGAREGAFFDTLASGSDGQGPRSIQITKPSNYSPALRRTAFLKNATKIAKQLLSPDCVFVGDMILLKTARIGTGTPWHQDEAFRDARFTRNEITFWMPLRDVSIDEGCMLFVPGSHRLGVLEHRSPNNDPRAHALECCGDFPRDEAVACPLPAGGCTIHTSKTIHCTKTNTSPGDRYAYTLVFAERPTPAANPISYPWLDEKQTEDQRAKRAWLRRGGVFIMLIRKLREGGFATPGGVAVAFKRGLRMLRSGQ